MKPKKVSEFPLKPALDGKGFIQIQEGAENKRISEQVILDALKKKVDAVEGRQLSEENYTKLEKEKLSQCQEVFDLTPMVGQIMSGTVTQDLYDNLLSTIEERRKLITIGWKVMNAMVSGPDGAFDIYLSALDLYEDPELASPYLSEVTIIRISQNLKASATSLSLKDFIGISKLEKRIQALENKLA